MDKSATSWALRLTFGATALCCGGDVSAQAWLQFPGKLTDIAFGIDGTNWGVAPETHKAGGAIFRRNGDAWEQVPGLAERIAVDPEGKAWVVNSLHEIYRYDGTSFVRVDGAAIDIAIGPDGTAWIVGASENDKDGFPIFRRDESGWTKVLGRGMRIAVDRAGTPWIAGPRNVGKFNGETFEPVAGFDYAEPGVARDISVAPNGTVWVIGPAAWVYSWDGQKTRRSPARGYSIAVAPDNVPWVVTNMGVIFYLSNTPAPPVPPGKRWHCEVAWDFHWTHRSFEGWGPEKSVAIENARHTCAQQSLPQERVICGTAYLGARCEDNFIEG